MTMKKKILIVLAALLGVAALDVVKNQLELPLAKVTVRVLDENQQPLAGASVSLGFLDRVSTKDVFVRGTTDAAGLFTGEGGCDISGVGNEVTMNGYYRGWAPIPKFHEIDADNRRKPWNETFTATLRPIGNAVALWAKRVQTQVPVLDQPCGYDLEKGDWVAPYGTGSKSDLIFKVKRDYKDWFNFTVEADVTFAQPRDGLVSMKSPAVGQNSTFKWDRIAPEAGFTAPHIIRFVNHDPKTGQHPEQSFDLNDKYSGYFFRVRTIEQNGQIIAANYGKITGDIGIEPRDNKTCLITFTYYLNPTSLDRHLEWNPKQNLFQGLSYDQTPREP
jgi:hypothetical protein